MEADISHLASLDPENLKLTLEFIARRTDLNIKTKQDKINYLCQCDHISISCLMRVFSMTYPTAEMIINDLINQQIIKKIESGNYHIQSRTKLKRYFNDIIKYFFTFKNTRKD